MRKISMKKNYLFNEPSSVVISMGNTKVLTAATKILRLPPHINPEKSGWITAEYSMMPRSSSQRVERDRKGVNGRSMEIQRLIGRVLRNVFDLSKMKGISVIVDADVIQADGGTRTASINGGIASAYLLFQKLIKEGLMNENPINFFAGAVGVALKNGKIFSDADYEADFNADADMNIVMNEKGNIIELQITGEKRAIEKKELEKAVKMAEEDIKEIIAVQKKICGVKEG